MKQTLSFIALATSVTKINADCSGNYALIEGTYTRDGAEAACNAAGYNGLATILNSYDAECAVAELNGAAAWIDLESSGSGEPFAYGQPCTEYIRISQGTFSQNVANCAAQGGQLAQFDSAEDVIEIQSTCGQNVCHLGFETAPSIEFIDGTPIPTELQFWFNPNEPHQNDNWNCGCITWANYGGQGNVAPYFLADCCCGCSLYGICDVGNGAVDVSCPVTNDEGSCIALNLWEEGKPHRCDTESQCVGILTNGQINNDVQCEETRSAALCNTAAFCSAGDAAHAINAAPVENDPIAFIDPTSDKPVNGPSITTIMLYAGVIAFILLNNVFICYWCMCKDHKSKMGKKGYEEVDVIAEE